jgi:hypothetical protein
VKACAIAAVFNISPQCDGRIYQKLEFGEPVSLVKCHNCKGIRKTLPHHGRMLKKFVIENSKKNNRRFNNVE